MVENESYANAWTDRRRRLWMCFLAALVFLVVYGVAGWLEAPENLQIGILVGCGALVLATAWWAAAFPCPRCHATFGGNVLDSVFGNGRSDARKCAKCGLPVDGGPHDSGSK